MEIVGIQREKSFFRLAYLSMMNGEVVIKGLEKQEGVSDLKTEGAVVTGIAGQDLLIRHLKTPLKKGKALQKILPFQLEALIPCSLDDVVIKPIYGVEEEETKALFFAVSKKTLESHISDLQKEGIDPDWVSAVPMALFRFARFVASSEEDLVVFHVGEEKIQLVSIQSGKILSHITLHMGSHSFNSGERSTAISQLKQAVDRAFCFLDHKEKKSGVRKTLFCGEEAGEMESLLREESNLLIPIKIKTHRGFDGDTVRPYAISIGLAIDALANDSCSIQFRQDTFIAKKSYRSIRKGLFYGGMISTVLSALTLICLQMLYHQKEKEWMNQVKGLVSHYEKEIPSLGKGVRKGSLEEILADLSLKLQLSKNEGLLFTKPPLVTDVLSFVSVHPKLQGITIKQIDYDLESYPSIQRVKAHYRPKVRLIFTTKDDKEARAFHDAIVDDERIVNQTEKIEWKRSEDDYEIAFFVQT